LQCISCCIKHTLHTRSIQAEGNKAELHPKNLQHKLQAKCLFLFLAVADDLRRKAWPMLLDLDDHSSSAAPTQEENEAHPEYRQVVMDVNRSLKRFPPGTYLLLCSEKKS
jgi:hypothetical protein